MPAIDPKSTAELGAQIYDAKYRHVYESQYAGQYVAIDIPTEEAFLATTPEEALQQARASHPTGVFHLIRVGAPGVFKLGYSRMTHGDWVFGR
jgi:hypothetical protein